MHLVITIVIVVDWRMNLLNEVEVLTTRLSEDILRPTHYKTDVRQGAHIRQLTAWPVPHACAQPYHPGSGSHGQLFRPYWGSSAWHSRNSTQPVKN